MFRRAFLVLSLILVIGFVDVAIVDGQTRLSAREQKVVDLAVAQQMERQQAVGVAVGVIRDGNVACLKGYGFADREKQLAVSTKSMFRWASISKTLTAIAAMQLVEEGRLDLKADVRTLIPEFSDKGTTITVRDLLCHQSRIVHHANGPVVNSTGVVSNEAYGALRSHRGYTRTKCDRPIPDQTRAVRLPLSRAGQLRSPLKSQLEPQPP